VRQLGPGAEALDVDGGEQVLEVDAGADRADREQDALEDRSVLVDAGVVRDEEGAAVEEQARA
jgi:hypothetical protein